MNFAKKTTRVGLLALAGMLAVCGNRLSAQDTPKDEKPKEAAADNRLFTFKSGFEKGQSLRYHTQQSMLLKFPGSKEQGALGLTSGINATLRYLVREAKPGGEASVAYLFEEGRLMDAENAIKILPKEADDTPRVATMSSLLHILKMKDESKSKTKDGKDPLPDISGNDAGLFLQIHFVPLPEKSVKIGDSWSVNYPRVNAKEKEESKLEKPDEKKPDDKAKGTVTLIGVEKFDGQEYLKVKHTLTLPFEAYTDAKGAMVAEKKQSKGRVVSQMTYTQIAYLFSTSGLLLRAEGKVEGLIKFEGAVAKLVPSDTMVFEGEFITGRMKDKE
jgi:hypothetical protein